MERKKTGKRKDQKRPKKIQERATKNILKNTTSLLTITLFPFFFFLFFFV